MGWGASPKRRAKEPPAEYISTMLDVHVHNLLNMKRFHGVLAGNVHESSLKSRIGKVRIIEECRLSNNFSRLTYKFSRVFEPLKAENRPVPTHIFSV